jgi:hypothetical protein
MSRFCGIVGAGICSLAIMLPFMADAQTLRITNYKDGVPVAGVRDSVILSDGRWAALTSGIDGICEITPQGWITGVKEIASQAPLNVKIYPRNTLVSGSLGIILELPKRGEVNLAGYTITGQRLFEFSGIYDAGIWEFSKETSHWAQQPIFIRAVFGSYAVSTKAIIMHSGFQNEPKVSDNGVTRIGDVSRVTRQIGLSKPNDLAATIYAVGDHLYLPWDSTTISLSGDITLTSVNGESGNLQQIKLINSLNYLTADSLVNDAKITLSDGRIRNSKNGKINYVSKKGATIDNAIIEHQDFYRQNQYFIVPDKDTSQALLILQKNPKTGLESITEEQMDFIGQVCNLSWCNVDTLTTYFMNQDSSGRPYPQGTAPLDTTDTKQKAFMNKMLERMALDNEQSKNYNKPWGIYKNIKIKLNNIIPDWNTSGWGAFNYSNLYPSTFWASSGSQFDHNNPSVIISFGTNWNAKRTIIDMDGETYEFNRAIYSVNNAGNAGVPMWSMYNINSWIFRDITWDFQQAVDRYIQHIQNLPNGLSGINLGSQPNRTITLGHLGIIPKYPTTP